MSFYAEKGRFFFETAAIDSDPFMLSLRLSTASGGVAGKRMHRTSEGALSPHRSDTIPFPSAKSAKGFIVCSEKNNPCEESHRHYPIVSFCFPNVEFLRG